MSLPNIDTGVLFIVLAFVVGLVGIAALIIGLTRFGKTHETVSTRIQDFIAPPHRTDTTERMSFRLLPRELSGSIYNRTLQPFFQRIVDYFGKFTPANSIAAIEHQLVLAGNPMNLHARDFYGIRMISLIAGVALGILLNYGTNPLVLWKVLMGVVIILFFFLIPEVWLNYEVRQRKEELRRNLPDALDMLSVCATAGLGFDQSLKKIVEYWNNPLSQEFKHVLQEMEMGISRADALRNMSIRLEVNDISSFIAIMIQAESIGMSFAEVLHSQADQMRILRQFRAKELANQMPAKMIIPIVIFIFPALLAVIMGPVIPTIFGIFQ